MSKNPAFLFYSQDFLTGTMFMNNEQIGIYIKLLCLQHQHGGIIDKISFNTFTNNDKVIKSKFIETEDGFYNHRLMLEMNKRAIKSSNLSINAKKRWAIEKEKQCKSNAIASNLHMPIEDEDENVNVNKDKKKFKPPLLEDVVKYFFESGYTEESAVKAYNYYSVANWIDSKGKKVRNWKQKMQGVWFRDEHEIKNNKPKFQS
jgi:uncharacterized protein YdaU (DUF1376 family)